MAYAEGTHYVIQAKRLSSDAVVYVNYEGDTTSISSGHSALRRLMLKKTRVRPSRYNYEDDDDDDYRSGPEDDVRQSPEPFGVRIWPLDTKPSKLSDQIRAIRFFAGKVDIDPNSIRLMKITVTMGFADPEPESELQLEMRKLALEKLTDEEKEILKVKHWEVFHKLGDRTGLDDEEDDEMPF